MTTARLFTLLLLALGHATAVISSGVAAQQQNPPVFRTRSTLVSVEVSVRAGNNAVVGLGPGDFRLTDNGVPQKIDLVDLDAVPVDISLVVDVSGSTSARLEQYKADVRAIATTIRAQDRLRVITFATDPKQVMALQPAGAVPEVDNINAGSSSSVYDGIAAALIRRVDLDRRHLIVAFTDGQENSSILTLEMLMGLAKQSEAVLHLAGSSSRDMNEVAEATGGANHLAPNVLNALTGTGSMLRDFNKIFADFRQSYVLRFQPAGVTPPGWHDLKVTVPGRGRVTIQARRGTSGGRSIGTRRPVVSSTRDMTRLPGPFLGAIVALSPVAAAPAQDPLTLVITRNGDPPTGVTVLVILNGEKRKDDGASVKAVAGKYSKGTTVDVYRWICEDGKIQLIIAPAGETLGVEDKDCLKTKEPPPGNPCRCGWIGGFKLGDVTTIDAEAGRVK